jgi:hypothetical protein
MRRPHDNTYWLEPNRILAGEYPSHPGAGSTQARLREYIACGITDFLDLTTPGELQPYEDQLSRLASTLSIDVSYCRLPIQDMAVPERPEVMVEILDEIERRLDADGTVYIHCWGGIGRTGTVAGCFLVRHGLTGDAALGQLARLWPQMKKSAWYPTTPQTEQQFEYVRNWRED